MVFDDADVAATAAGIAGAGYFNAGQDCTAATRVLAGPAVADGLRQDDEMIQEEIFGPVITVQRFGSEDEAVR